MDTPALIRAAQVGNLQAFNRLVLLNQDAIFGLVCHLLPGRADAETITHAIFQQVYQDLPKYHVGSFRTWLYATVVKACRQVRKESPRKTNTAFEFLPTNPGACSVDQLNPTHQNLHLWLNGLDFNLRVVLVLVDMEKMDYAQAAQILGLPVRLLQSRLAKARQQVLSDLIRDHPAEVNDASLKASI